MIVASNERLMMFASPSTKTEDEQLFFGDISMFIKKFRVVVLSPILSWQVLNSRIDLNAWTTTKTRNVVKARKLMIVNTS